MTRAEERRGPGGPGTLGGPRLLRRLSPAEMGVDDGAGDGDGNGPGGGGGSGGGNGSGGGPGGRGPGAGAYLHIVRFAPAKLNLTLAVTGRRDDGYHALHSVMVPLSLGDALTVSVPHGARHDTLRVSGLPLTTDPDNLVLRAIAATRAAVEKSWPGAPAAPPWLAARLVKRTPIAAGLGGGSSDAAVAIEAALAAWHTAMLAPDKAKLAVSLGSDVPFFLAGSNALITGRGEFVDPLPHIGGEPPAILLVTPHLPVSTPAAFAAYAAGARLADRDRARGISERLAASLRAGMTSVELLGMAGELAAANDLLPATLTVAPGLVDFIVALQKTVGRPVCQSGSGPTQWVLYPTLAEARKAGRGVRQAFADGTIPQVGDGEPFVTAAAIMPPHVLATESPVGPTVHNGPKAVPIHNGGSPMKPHTPKGDTTE